ncbi:MAG: hypothetical protein ACJAUG_001731 [Halioglobus sp.]|jgi:hypothetical protein
MRIIVIVAALMTSLSAGATPISWTLKDVVFNDGSTASGSYS